ncbi:Cro/C1-type HTH DNA-binding domain protein [Halobacteriovorax sp. BALOs_7]|nr:Cro/C1-type HTH DNA-binding domain protein [Halobacteriovorax sp. BALOs_7]
MSLKTRLNSMNLLLRENLRKILADLDWSVPKLAKETGVPSSTIQNWMEGKPAKDITQVKCVAECLGVTVDELCFSETVPEVKNPLNQFEDEINAGVFEVILRRVKR